MRYGCTRSRQTRQKTRRDDRPAAGQVQSLTRGLKLLEWIAESNGSVALTELAQQAGLPNSTTHRLLTTMQQQGFVRQVGDLGHWAIGAHAFIVGSSFYRAAICWRSSTLFCAN